MADREMPTYVLDMLTRPNPAVIATVSATGAPVTVATWYLWEQGRVLVNMDGGRLRLEHIRRDRRVSLTVLHGSDWHAHVSLRGRVIDLVDDPELVDIDRLAHHYTGKRYPVRDRARVSGWIEVDNWHEWGF